MKTRTSSADRHCASRPSRAGRSLGFGLLACATAALGAETARAEITAHGPLDVRIVLDNSGSMYPGYRPGTGVMKSDLGVLFVREYPEFRRWLTDFVARQSVLHGNRVSLYAMTSGPSFQPRDLQQIWSPTPLASFSAGEALDRIQGWGRFTFLAEGLAQVSQGFEGLVWLITDNIVETGEGLPDIEVTRFFHEIDRTVRYRSVHLFKLPVTDPQRKKVVFLAVYGILVSSIDPGPDVLASYDRLFRGILRIATRQSGGATVPLFEGQEHLKLKDLNIDTLSLRFQPNLTVRVSPRSLFRERQDLHLQLRGEIRSNLTHHTVIGGRYQLQLVSPFRPDDVAKREFGVGEIPDSGFEPASRALTRPIPPTGILTFDEEISSIEPVSLRTGGLSSWIKAALSGVRAHYAGTVRLSFGRVKVQFERERLSGIFGSERASEVFRFKDQEEINADAVEDEITFQMETSAIRSFILLIALAPILIGAAILARLFLTKEHYLIHVGSEEKTVGLRRLESVPVELHLQLLGRVRRPLSGLAQFRPVVGIPGIEVLPDAVAGTFVARLSGQGSVTIAVVPLLSAQGYTSTNDSGSACRRPGAGPLTSSPSIDGPSRTTNTPLGASGSQPPPTFGRPK